MHPQSHPFPLSLPHFEFFPFFFYTSHLALSDNAYRHESRPHATAISSLFLSLLVFKSAYTLFIYSPSPPPRSPFTTQNLDTAVEYSIQPFYSSSRAPPSRQSRALFFLLTRVPLHFSRRSGGTAVHMISADLSHLLCLSRLLVPFIASSLPISPLSGPHSQPRSHYLSFSVALLRRWVCACW
jgi:hypothetical protein